MATLRNKKKLVAVSREPPENTRNNRSQNAFNPVMAKEYISQVSEEIEVRVTKNLSNEFSRIESRILGALSKLREHPGTTTQKTGNPLGIVPYTIPVPKWCSLSVTPVI